MSTAIVPSRNPVEISAPVSPIQKGDSVVILDLPTNFTIGIDVYAISAKEFAGFRDVAFGAHLIWVTPSAGHAPRSGAWIWCDKETIQPRIHMLRWCAQEEVLKPASYADVERNELWLRDTESKRLWAQDPVGHNTEHNGNGLDPEPHKKQRLWWQLTSFITPRVLDRVIGQTERDWFVHTTDSVRGAPRMAAEVELDNSLSGGSSLHGKELAFNFPEMYNEFKARYVGAALTQNSLDASDFVSYLQPPTGSDPLDRMTQWDLQGEFQLAYLLGAHLGNDACVYQWQQILLRIILRSFSLAFHVPDLAKTTLAAFGAQVEHSMNYLDTPLMLYNEHFARDIRVALTVYKKRYDETKKQQQDTQMNHIAEAAAGGTDISAISQTLTFIELLVAEPPLEWNLRSEETLRKGIATTDEGEQFEVELAELEDEDERGEYAPEVVEMDEDGRQMGMVSFNQAD